MVGPGNVTVWVLCQPDCGHKQGARRILRQDFRAGGTDSRSRRIQAWAGAAADSTQDVTAKAHQSGPGFHQCSEPLGVFRARGRQRWRARGKSDAFQDFPRGLRRMNRCEDPHAALAARALRPPKIRVRTYETAY